MSELSRLRELHNRLGSMIDQVGQPDYSLRELVKGLRDTRDELLTLSEKQTCPRCGYPDKFNGVPPNEDPPSLR
jgi:hypothetical protein